MQNLQKDPQEERKSDCAKRLAVVEYPNQLNIWEEGTRWKEGGNAGVIASTHTAVEQTRNWNKIGMVKFKKSRDEFVWKKKCASSLVL